MTGTLDVVWVDRRRVIRRGGTTAPADALSTHSSMDVPPVTHLPGRDVGERAHSHAGTRSGAGKVWEALPAWVHTGTGALLRCDWWVLPIAAGILALLTAATSLASSVLVDGHLFTTAGCQLLEGHVSAPYSNPRLQSGPLQNGLYCIASKVTVFGPPAIWFGVAGAGLVSVVLLGLRLVRRRAALDRSRAVVAVAAAYITFWAVPTLLSAHLAEVLVPVLWVGGALLIRRHPLWAGLVLGASVGVELWGLVAIPVVLAARTWGGRLLGAAVAGLVAGAVVLPFAAAGHLAMFHFRWPVMPHTLPALIWPAPATGPPFAFGVAARVLQLILALAGCAVVAYRVRDDARLLPWAPALTAEFLRLLVDPTMYTYYWVTPELLVAVALVCAAGTRQRLIVAAVGVLQVAGELDEYRVLVVALSLLLVGSAVLGRTEPSRRVAPDAPIRPLAT